MKTHFLVCAITLYRILSFINCLDIDVIFSTNIPKEMIFKMNPHMSIKSCSRECSVRGRCKKAIYNRAAKVCCLTMETNQTSRYGNVLPGFVELRKNDIKCGDLACNENESCISDTSGPVCRITDCGILSREFHTTKSNSIDVNSTNSLEYIPTSILIKMKCTLEGKWIPIDPHCCLTGCQSGVTVRPYGVKPFYCDMDTDGGNWLVFQRRQDGSEDFYRPWKDYEDGFGNLEGEFWLGLIAMYQILSTGTFELRIDMEDFDGEKKFGKCSHFSIDGPKDLYRLHVNGFTGNVGDSFTRTDGHYFSTYDNDNDISEHNCAYTYEGGWWYDACHGSNLNGRYYHGGQNTTTYGENINWSHWHGFWTSLKSTEMKFRRIK